MTYFVEVLLDRVVCREPESNTGPDLFSLVTSIATKKHFTKDDADAWVKVHELKRIRRGDSENYSKVIFKGFATEPTLYLVLLGFDIDRNSIWADNEDEIRKK